MRGLLKVLFAITAKAAGQEDTEQLDAATTKQIVSDIQSGKSDAEIMAQYGISQHRCLRFRRKKTHWLLEREGLSGICGGIVFFASFFLFLVCADSLKWASNETAFKLYYLLVAIVPAIMAYVIAYRYLFRDVYIDVSKISPELQGTIFAVILLGFIATVLLLLVRV